MNIAKTDNVSFGTKPLIGVISAGALCGYKPALTKGILDAFQKLEKNGVDDKLVVRLGYAGAKKKTTNALDIAIFDSVKYKSSTKFSPRTLANLTKEEISNFIIETYNKLIKSNRKASNHIYYPLANPKSKNFEDLSPTHREKLMDLVNKYGFDDWTCA